MTFFRSGHNFVTLLRFVNLHTSVITERDIFVTFRDIIVTFRDIFVTFFRSGHNFITFLRFVILHASPQKPTFLYIIVRY